MLALKLNSAQLRSRVPYRIHKSPTYAVSLARSLARLRLNQCRQTGNTVLRASSRPQHHSVQAMTARTFVSADGSSKTAQPSSDQVGQRSQFSSAPKSLSPRSEQLRTQEVIPAPWSLHGDAFLLPTLTGLKAIQQYDTNPLPDAKHWGLAGAIILVRYHDTSVGPYNELIFTPGLHRLGRHVGFHISQIYVDSQRSLEGGRANWAVPKKLAVFDWQEQDSHIQLQVKLPNASQPFFTASFKQSKVQIPASSALVPPPLKTILQACDPKLMYSKCLSTRVQAAGQLHVLSKIKVQTQNNEVPKDSDLGIWQKGISLIDFQGTFAKPQPVVVNDMRHKR